MVSVNFGIDHVGVLKRSLKDFHQLNYLSLILKNLTFTCIAKYFINYLTLHVV